MAKGKDKGTKETKKKPKDDKNKEIGKKVPRYVREGGQ